MQDFNQENSQLKYRQKQSSLGMVRYELQVSEKSKSIFESMVNTAANELNSPKGIRLRKAKARAMLFDKLVNQLSEDFLSLKDKIYQLQAHIKTLSSRFKLDNHQLPQIIPESIANLSDDTKILKQYITKLHFENSHLKQRNIDLERNLKQYQAINDVLTEQLK